MPTGEDPGPPKTSRKGYALPGTPPTKTKKNEPGKPVSSKIGFTNTINKNRQGSLLTLRALKGSIS